MSDLVKNPEDRFSHDEADFMLLSHLDADVANGLTKCNSPPFHNDCLVIPSYSFICVLGHIK